MPGSCSFRRAGASAVQTPGRHCVPSGRGLPQPEFLLREKRTWHCARVTTAHLASSDDAARSVGKSCKRRVLVLWAPSWAPLPAPDGRRARRPSGAAPEVDRLTVTVVTDNYLYQFLPRQNLDGLRVARSGSGGSPGGVPPRDRIMGEWGLSMLATSGRGDEARNVLVNFGYSPEVLLNNLRLLGINPTQLDAMVLSHGHYDHFGGPRGFLTATRGSLKRDLAFFVGGKIASARAKLPAAGPISARSTGERSWMPGSS